MSDRSTSATPTPRLEWARSLAFGIACAGIGTVGHAAAGNGTVHWLVFAIAFALITVVARMYADVQLPRWGLALAVVAGQLLVHVACGSMSTSMVHAAAVHHMDHAAAGGGLQVSVGMLLVHGVATVVALVVLLRLEVVAWSTVASVATRIVRRLAAFVQAALRTTSSTAPSLDIDVLPLRRHRRWAATSAGRRGPPLRTRTA